MEDSHRLSRFADGPLLLLIFEHEVNHLLLARAVTPTDAHYEGLAVVVDQVDVDFLKLAEVKRFFVSLGGLGGGDGLCAFGGVSLHVEFNLIL